MRGCRVRHVSLSERKPLFAFATASSTLSKFRCLECNIGRIKHGRYGLNIRRNQHQQLYLFSDECWRCLSFVQDCKRADDFIRADCT
jgi:hypothetical protein